MKLEARSAQASQRPGMNTRIRDITAEINKLRADLKKQEATYNSQMTRNELFSGMSDDSEVCVLLKNNFLS